MNRELYGLKKAKRGPKEKEPMPYFPNKRHEIRTVDVRYIDHDLAEENKVYVISVLENHSRAIFASSASRSKEGPYCRAYSSGARQNPEFGAPS